MPSLLQLKSHTQLWRLEQPHRTGRSDLLTDVPNDGSNHTWLLHLLCEQTPPTRVAIKAHDDSIQVRSNAALPPLRPYLQDECNAAEGTHLCGASLRTVLAHESQARTHLFQLQLPGKIVSTLCPVVQLDEGGMQLLQQLRQKRHATKNAN